MQEADTRSLGQIVIALHDIARELERKNPLTNKAPAQDVRAIADRIAYIQRMERDL